MLLRKDDPWPKNMSIPDVRNWRVVDEDGREIGFVETVIVDRQDDAVEAIFVGPNERFLVDEIETNGNLVRVGHAVHRVSADANAAEIPAAFDDAFRMHFAETYGDSESSYERLLPAYLFGREMASDADFAGRSAADSEEDLKAHYLDRSIRPPYEVARPAVRFAYEAVHGVRPYKMGDLDRESRQILKPEHIHADESADAGSSTSMMKPGDEPVP